MSEIIDINATEEEEFEIGSVTLTLDDDSELDCDILCVFPAGEQQYIALLPLGEDGEPDPDADILLFRYTEEDDGETFGIDNIEDDDEYEQAAEAFDELLDETLFEFGDGEEEEE